MESAIEVVPARAGHEVKVTRSVQGLYGWTLSVSNDGATAADVKASLAAIAEVDKQMRENNSSEESD